MGRRYQPEHAAPRRRRTWSAVLVDWAVVFGLASVGLSVPLLRILGPDPEFFIAHGATGGETARFGVVVGLIVPGVLATMGVLVALVSPTLRSLLVAVLGAVAVASVLQALSGVTFFYLLCGVLGVLLAYAERREAAARAVACLAAVAGVLVVGWFLGPSRTGSYIAAPAGAAEAASTIAEPPDAPVVIVTFDELPLSALLDADLEIDAERFPSFARLAAQSDWYRQASSVSPQTSASVPALWSGVEPDEDLVPIASSYPTSVFAQLGAHYQGHVREPITSICPASVCGDATQAASAPVEAAEPDLVGDSLVVLAHGLASEDSRADLPSISAGWGGFDAGAFGVDVGGEGGAHAAGATGTFPAEAEAATAWADGCVDDGERPPLCVLHVAVPHLPYVAMPDGSTYPATSPMPGADSSGGSIAWQDDEALRMQAYQRLLLQLGATDRLLGELMDVLEANGVWDEAVVGVVADHGVSFAPGGIRAGTSVEVTGVPMFIKAPGQDEGRVHDDAALTIDLVPTMLGHLRVAVPSDVDGVDLGAHDVGGEREDGYRVGGQPTTPDQSLDALQALVDERAAWVDPDGGWPAVHAVGPAAELVGAPPPDAGTPAGRWRPMHGAEVDPAVFSIQVAPDVEVASLLVVRDGQVVASMPGAPSGTTTLRTVISPTGSSQPVTLLAVDADGGVHPLERAP